jgi:hypothetical protein
MNCVLRLSRKLANQAGLLVGRLAGMFGKREGFNSLLLRLILEYDNFARQMSRL